MPPIGTILHRDPRRAQPRRHGFYPVTFFNAQLFDTVHPGDTLCKTGHHGKDWIFVNHRGRPLRRHRNPLHIRGIFRAQISHGLATFLAHILKCQIRTHLLQGVEQAGTGRIEANIGH